MADKTRYKVTVEIISTSDSEFNTCLNYDLFEALNRGDGQKIEWAGEPPDDPIYIEEYDVDNDERLYVKIDPDGTVHDMGYDGAEYNEGL